MDSSLGTIVIGIVLGVAGSIIVKRAFGRKTSGSDKEQPRIYAFVENMKSVGELVVFKAFTKEIVTTADNWLGEVGKKYLTWLMSNMKMAMILQGLYRRLWVQIPVSPFFFIYLGFSSKKALFSRPLINKVLK